MWKEQWERVLRHYKWVGVYTQTTTPGIPGEDTHDCTDRVLSFFVECYSLKDWLKNDPAIQPRTLDVEVELRKSTAMQIVADLANGKKHLDLSAWKFGPKTGDPTTALSHQDVRVTIGAGTLQKMTVESNSVGWDVYDLAAQAVGWWRAFLTQRKLLP